jgi:hypothetical protein
MMQVVCAWCGKGMGEKMGPDGLITHGICPACEAVALEEMEALKQLPGVARRDISQGKERDAIEES